MAQRTIHYLFGEIIASQITIHDKRRFLLGNIMPDAVEIGSRDRSHYKIKTDTQVYYDFEAFASKYHQQMLQDDLYLGYYMHLIEDAFYRVFLYNDRFRMPRTQDEVKILHDDYHKLNSYIVRKYNIHNTLEMDIDLAGEAVCEIADFYLPEFLDEMAADFTEQTEGNTVFLTESMLDEFIETYVPLAIKEVIAVRNGSPVLKVDEYAWSRKR